MNMSTVLKKLLILLMTSVFLTFARPSSLINSHDLQDVANEYESKLTELQNYYDYQSPSLQDSNSMDKLLLLYLYPDSRSSDNSIYRMPESKRQVRYRQCYFNPISCFRK